LTLPVSTFFSHVVLDKQKISLDVPFSVLLSLSISSQVLPPSRGDVILFFFVRLWLSFFAFIGRDAGLADLTFFLFFPLSLFFFS